MAFTVSSVTGSVFGNKLVKVMRVTTDSAENTVTTGLNVVDWITITPQSMVTNGVKYFLNVGTTATAANGLVAISNVTSGDVFYIAAYGH